MSAKQYLYTVYQTTNKTNNMIYIGVHKTLKPNDSYMGSGIWLKRAIKTHGKKHFDKEVLHIYKCPTAALLKERQIVNKDFIERADTYNLKIGGGRRLGILGYKFNETQLSKLRKSQKKRWSKLSMNERKELCEHLIGRKNGFKLSKSHKNALKPYQFKKGYTPHNSTPISINGVQYDSITEAERILEISKNTIRHRLQSKNFENYVNP